MAFNDIYNRKKSEVSTASTADLQQELSKRQTGENIFPLEIFHPKIKPFINELHAKMDIPRSYIGLAMLMTYSTAIGTAYAVSTNGSDRQFMSTWGCINGISSSGKSLALKMCMKPLKDIQRDLTQARLQRIEGLTDEKKSRVPIDLVIFRDIHLATLARYILPENPKGVLKESDEILEWINGLNALSKKEGTDEQFWLSAWDVSGYEAVRSGNVQYTVPRVFTNIVGGIQPSLLYKLFKNDRGVSGFIFRLLFAIPETYKIASPLPGYDIPVEYKSIHDHHVKSLYYNLPVESGYDDPKVCLMSKEATRLFTTWKKNRIAQINDILELNEKGIHAGILGKMEGYAYRFAGILCVTDHAFNVREIEPHFPNQLTITEDIMVRALKAADYFFKTAVDIYEAVDNSVTAPLEVLDMAVLYKKGTSRSQMAKLLLGNPKSKGQMTRMLDKAKKEYPKVFGADNSR